MDDLTRARARRIAKERTTDEIRADILKLQAACPNCGAPLRSHDSAAIDACALALDTQPKTGA